MEPITIQKTEAFRRTRYGLFGHVAANGCGAIAAYNVLNGLGEEVSFPKVIKGLRKRLGMAFGFGLLGTNIYSLMAYLASFFRLRICLIFLRNRKKLKTCDAVIIHYYWRSKKRIGAHFISGIKNEDGDYTFYNYSAVPRTASLDSFLMNMKKEHELPLWVIGIKRKGQKI